MSANNTELLKLRLFPTYMKVTMGREEPSAQQKQTSTTELITATSFAVGRPHRGWTLVFFAIWRKTGVASLLFRNPRITWLIFTHYVVNYFFFPSKFKKRSELIWYWNMIWIFQWFQFSNGKLECSGQLPVSVQIPWLLCAVLQTFQYFCAGLKPAHSLEQEGHRRGRGCAWDLLEWVDDLC